MGHFPKSFFCELATSYFRGGLIVAKFCEKCDIAYFTSNFFLINSRENLCTRKLSAPSDGTPLFLPKLISKSKFTDITVSSTYLNKTSNIHVRRHKNLEGAIFHYAFCKEVCPGLQKNLGSRVLNGRLYYSKTSLNRTLYKPDCLVQIRIFRFPNDHAYIETTSIN